VQAELETVLAPLGAALPDATLLVSVHDHDAQQLLVVAARDGAHLDLDAGLAVPLGRSFCAATLTRGAPAICGDVAAEPAYAEVDERLGSSVTSYAGVPLQLADGRQIGSVTALSPLGDRFTARDREALGDAARRLVAVLERDPAEPAQRLRAEARRRSGAERRRRLRQAVPFLAAGLLAFAMLPLGGAGSHSAAGWTAAVLAALLVLSVVLVPWHALGPVIRMTPAYGSLVVIALLRDAAGGAASGLAVLVVLPVLWIALHGSRRELLLAVAGVALTLLLPPALAGAPLYPESEWRRGVISTVVALLIGHAVQDVVRLARARAAELQRRARSLHASEEDKRLILATAGEGIVGVDADGLVTFANATAVGLTGWAADELLGRPFHRLLADSEDCEVCVAMVEERPRRSRDGVFRRADDRRFPVEYVVRPFRRAGAGAGAVVTFRDVTEHRTAERALREEREFLAALVASLREGIVACGPDGEVELANDAFGDALGHLHRPDGRTKVAPQDTPLARAYRGEAVRDAELVIAVPGADPRAVVANGQPVVAPGGRRLGAVMALHDVTERRHAERMKDEFFALVSHELRTPLTSILGYLQVLVEEDAEGDLLPPHHRRFLGTIERNAQRLERLVGDLLFVAQFDAGRLALEPGRADLAVLAGEAVDAGLPRSVDRGVHLRLDPDGELVAPCPGDAGRLGQVLDNLVSNALKFTPPGGAVTVRAGAEPGLAWVEVSDTGIGIPAGELDRLFDRFFRASSATEREIPGVGLGLAISKAVIDGHGGTISVRSTVDAGTTFRVELPAAAEPVALAA